jgi:hypothetical protein
VVLVGVALGDLQRSLMAEPIEGFRLNSRNSRPYRQSGERPDGRDAGGRLIWSRAMFGTRVKWSALDHTNQAGITRKLDGVVGLGSLVQLGVDGVVSGLEVTRRQRIALSAVEKHLSEEPIGQNRCFSRRGCWLTVPGSRAAQPPCPPFGRALAAIGGHPETSWSV